MKPLAEVRQQLAAGQFDFSRHAFRRAVERNISDEEIRAAGERAEIIEEYPEDKSLPGRRRGRRQRDHDQRDHGRVNAALVGCPEPDATPTPTPTLLPATSTATATVLNEEFIARASDFDDFAAWPLVRCYHVTNKLGHLGEALDIATALGDPPDLQLPVGTIVQLVRGEAMVKRGGDFQPEHHGWEYFVLRSVGDQTEIVARGGIEANGGGRYNCHASARTFDYLCETTHDCSPEPSLLRRGVDKP
jgi:Domain of unknown function (DUF4258)